MTNYSNILQQNSLRVTKTRLALLGALHGQKPQDVQALLRFLSKQQKHVHKTTVYRDLEAFMNVNLVIPVQFGDSIVRYELANQPHHHHLVCKECGKVEDVHLAHSFRKLEKRLTQKYHFADVCHALEFYGQCYFCSTSSRNH